MSGQAQQTEMWMAWCLYPAEHEEKLQMCKLSTSSSHQTFGLKENVRISDWHSSGMKVWQQMDPQIRQIAPEVVMSLEEGSRKCAAMRRWSWLFCVWDDQSVAVIRNDIHRRPAMVTVDVFLVSLFNGVYFGGAILPRSSESPESRRMKRKSGLILPFLLPWQPPCYFV